ncbi:hypothetical protein ACFV8T_44685 [Streptomyces sp. NPDC059832]
MLLVLVVGVLLAAVEESSGSPWPTGHRFADRIRTMHATIHDALPT